MAKEGTVLKAKGTWYEPWMGDKIKEVASQGGHVAAMCVSIGIKSKDTFYRWINEYPDFKDAYEEAKLLSLKFYEELSLRMALGDIKGDAKTLAIILNNKFKDDYSRSANGAGTEINIGSINTIEKLSSDELDAKIKQLTKKISVIPDDDS